MERMNFEFNYHLEEIKKKIVIILYFWKEKANIFEEKPPFIMIGKNVIFLFVMNKWGFLLQKYIFFSFQLKKIVWWSFWYYSNDHYFIQKDIASVKVYMCYFLVI